MTPSSTSHIQPLLKLARNTPPWMAYVPIALVTLLGVLVTWHAFNTVTDWERQRVQQAFRAAAIDRVLMVQREIEQNLGVVQDIGSFFDASKWVGRREFRKFVGPQSAPRLKKKPAAALRGSVLMKPARQVIWSGLNSVRCIFLFSMCSPIRLTRKRWVLIWHLTR